MIFIISTKQSVQSRTRRHEYNHVHKTEEVSRVVGRGSDSWCCLERRIPLPTRLWCGMTRLWCKRMLSTPSESECFQRNIHWPRSWPLGQWILRSTGSWHGIVGSLIFSDSCTPASTHCRCPTHMLCVQGVVDFAPGSSRKNRSAPGTACANPKRSTRRIARIAHTFEGQHEERPFMMYVPRKQLRR